MDMAKIMNESVRLALTNRMNDPEYSSDDEYLEQLVGHEKFLFDYSCNLIESYHLELVQALAKQGITL